ncbi:MAG TPA: hypothetical protein VML54_08910, partial [Candidatus Limnocylindrales bacterium]|nr:hypothetical protein [Candidatus Limnocylindrales bacterium]
LLRAPIRDDDRPGRPFAYPRAVRLVVSAFIAFHALALIVYNSADREPVRGMHWVFNKYARLPLYIETIGHTQDWGMFSPHPPKENVTTRVFVVTREGRTIDLFHDPPSWREYPSLVYDPRVKVNERITFAEHIRTAYAGAVCRGWEESHRGESAAGVQMVTVRTEIPAPEVARRTGGYDPKGLDVIERAWTAHRCDVVPQGQLPNYLRARYGLPPRPDAPPPAPPRPSSGR